MAFKVVELKEVWTQRVVVEVNGYERADDAALNGEGVVLQRDGDFEYSHTKDRCGEVRDATDEEIALYHGG